MISHCTRRCKTMGVTFACLLLVSACSSSDITPGTDVHTHVTHLPSAATVNTTAAGKRFDNDQGVTIELTSAYLTLSEIDIRTNCSAHPFARVLDTLYEWVIPAAHAHTESTPTRLGEPLIVNVINPDSEELEFGHFSPAAGSYCGITVHMHPADADARNLPAALSMTGLVLHLEGSYDAGGGAVAFTVESAIEPEHADVAFHEPINLSTSNLAGEAHVNIAYNTWFNGMDGAAMTDLAAADAAAVAALLDNITASIGHHE